METTTKRLIEICDSMGLTAEASHADQTIPDILHVMTTGVQKLEQARHTHQNLTALSSITGIAFYENNELTYVDRSDLITVEALEGMMAKAMVQVQQMIEAALGNNT